MFEGSRTTSDGALRQVNFHVTCHTTVELSVIVLPDERVLTFDITFPAYS